ncbi:MAG TPA: dihydrolipoyl dehydrogenase [Burkholderiaceae bacterium]|nr:dihydrolipoyl dehydrogenase [bacterium SGD-2]HZH56191.1 dihydrolipoyl dehydrogenase [Burkholderiaceae bacterium]
MQSTNVLVVGGGPAGYVAALRTAQAGIATTLVERDNPGGTCLNIGCIPSKALIHAADEFYRLTEAGSSARLGIITTPPKLELARLNSWKQGIVSQLTGGVQALLKRAGVQVVKGDARVLDGKTVEVTPLGEEAAKPRRVVCQHLVLATGSVPAELPMLPFGARVISSTEALTPDELPATLIVIGAGYIGLELGMAYAKLGTRVTVVEAQDRILPAWDTTLTRPVQRRLQALGVELLLGTRVQGGEANAGTVQVKPESRQERTLQADKILVAVGRRPLATQAGIGGLMLDMQGPYIRVDEQCRTSMRNVWAIGDITGEPMLAHRAMAQAEVAAAVIAGRRRRFEPLAIPAVCYTDPEVAVAGLLPDEAKERFGDALVASFPFAGNGRALTLDAADGFVRVVARRDDHRIVGWQAVGPNVSELTAAFTQAIEMCARLEDIAGTIHAHPTLSEAVQEAALKALGQGLHG